MLDVLGVLFAVIVALTIAAALFYIGGFVISMFVSLIAAIDDIATHHHHAVPG